MVGGLLRARDWTLQQLELLDVQGPGSSKPCTAVCVQWGTGSEMGFLVSTPPQQGFPFSTQSCPHSLEGSQEDPRPLPLIHVYLSKDLEESRRSFTRFSAAAATAPPLGIQG